MYNNDKSHHTKLKIHCCDTMQYDVVSGHDVLDYNPKLREYGIKIPQSSIVILMDYCMFCGQKLPPSLRDKWFDILEEEYGLTDLLGKDKKKIPVEFLSDTWWLARGL